MDRRYSFHVKVVLGSGRTEIVTQTKDVSFKGVFVRSDTPLAERHLLRLRFTLPPEGDELEITGMVARGVPTRGSSSPGVGIQFFAASAGTRERWNRFIRFVAAGARALPAPQGAPASAAAPPVFPPGTPDAVRRKYPRYAAVLRVHIRDVSDLQQLYTRNVSKGGLFVGTTLELAPGTELKMAVIHPKSGIAFPLDAVVRWRAPPPNPGLGLEFTALDDHRRDAFFDFVRSEIPVGDVTYVADGDSRLVVRGPREPGDPTPEENVPPVDEE
jgi:Tfp pilus assembly protein PilZ